MTAERIDVGGTTGGGSYPVLVGTDLLGEIPAQLPGASRVAVLHQPSVPLVAQAVEDVLAAAGAVVTRIELPDGEAAKTVANAARCWDVLGEAGFTRSDAVVGVGGGAATDLAGWVAAAWLRGVRVLHVPTTLAGMVDAAVGGKTGVNTSRGKNLVGAFHPPAAVLCDLTVLATLPAADYRAGLAEVVKCGFIADPAILELLETRGAGIAAPGNAAEGELVTRAIRVKARVVGEDLTEQGLREILNYGHTLGHAIERAEGYRWRHGDAVAVGLVYAAAVARRLGMLDDATADRHRLVLESLGLPTRYRAGAFADLLATMRIDKKARGNTLRLVLLEGLARPRAVGGIDPALLADAYADIETVTIDATERTGA